VVAPKAVMLVDDPLQKLEATGVTVNTGLGFMVIVLVLVAAQPAVLTPVTV